MVVLIELAVLAFTMIFGIVVFLASLPFLIIGVVIMFFKRLFRPSVEIIPPPKLPPRMR